MTERVQAVLRLAGKLGLVFVVLLLAYLLLPNGLARSLALLALFPVTLWLGIRIWRAGFRYMVWRLRHRLLVTYLFIAVVPVALVIAMAVVSAYALVSQLAVYLVTSELDRRIVELAQSGKALVGVSPDQWPQVAPALMGMNERNLSAEVLVRSNGRSLRFPATSKLEVPGGASKSSEGLLLRDGHPYLWVYQKAGSADLTILEPVTRETLASLVPNLGIVDMTDQEGRPLELLAGMTGARMSLPPQMNRFDRDVGWFTTIPANVWETHETTSVILGVRTRVSAVLSTVFNRISDLAQGVLLALLVILAGLFLVVVGVAIIIGAAMTRSITGAVHDLYEATERVSEGTFSHRIAVRNADQLGELSKSFNNMTAHVEHLLTVAKEKERLESEVEIAREVQKHLYPRSIPVSQTLRLAAMCHPARTVSGDYYDYAALGGSRLALALGDVAGKGISAALLMASLQSGLRTDWQAEGERSTSAIVSRLNRQLYSNTSAEKYATFCLAIYDEALGVLTYTNAGHLPPLVLRGGEVLRFDVNGTVVGAFPMAKYEESYLPLESGDLLVFYTDGVTEPENTFGEMFGEERLIELLRRCAHRPEAEILSEVYDAVRQWTGAEELQDDLTLMLARRI